ncbi:MAG: phytoene desaturase family protein, partial [Acidimicrobiia bacterium]
MSERYDVVVAGAGHNGLVAAAYLAKAGLRCLVLEARPFVGGNTATEELTLPGFRHDSCSTAHNLIQASPTLRDDELSLEEYGLEYLHPDPVVHVPFPDGEWLTQWGDLDVTCEEFAKFSGRDADAYRRLIADYDAIKGVFGAYRYTPMGWGPSLDERLESHPHGRRWQRRRQMSAWEVIRDLFEDWHSRAFLLWMSFMTVQPVDRPGTGWLASSLVYGRQTHSWTLPRGGSGALPEALARLVEDHGGTILPGEQVTGLILEGGRCVGVETAGGDRHRASRAV